MKRLISLLLILSLAALSTQVFAQRVLRIDEVPVGELDPAKAMDFADSILMFNVYDALVIPRQGGPGMVPHLAESWETEGLSYVFRLRPDVRFHSGNPLTAQDVVFSLDRMKALGMGLSHLFADVESAEVIDERTVRFNLSQPFAPFVASLARLPIIDKALVMENLGAGGGEMGDWGQQFLSANSAGSGAYRVVSHNPLAETVLVKNEDYFLGVPDAAPDRVHLLYGLAAPTVRALIARSEHDISSQWLPPEVMRALAAEGAQLLIQSGIGAFYVKMNTTKAPLDDVNCRLALANAFDYGAILKMIAITDEVAQGTPSTGAIPVGMLGSNPAADVLKRDMDAARQHLANCRHDPADFTLELSWIAEVPIEERFALLMQANFAELGFKSEIRRIPWALFTEQVANPETTPHISQVFVTAHTGDPDALLWSKYHSSAAGTWQSPSHLADDRVDELLEKGRRAATEEERGQVYAALNDRLMEIAPSIYAFDLVSVFVASNRVRVPAMTDPSKAFLLNAKGFTFRLMEMTE